MKKYFFTALSLALFTIGFTASDYNRLFPDDPDSPTTTPDTPSVTNPEENTATEVTVNVTFDGNDLNGNGITVNSVRGSEEVGSGDQTLASNCNNLPQLYYVTDSQDNILMISRACVDEGTNIEINEETTALSLASLNPVFANITSEDFDLVENMIKSAPAFNALKEEVRKVIQNNGDVFNPDNQQLLVELSNVWDYVCNQANNSQAPAATRSIFTRASSIQGINPDPVSVETEGNDVIIRNLGLIPTYECQVYHGARLVATKLIESHSSYGFLDLFSSVEDFYYGDPQRFTLSEEGEYRFYLDRTTERAINDLSRRMWGDVLSMVGLYNCGSVLENSASVIGAIAPLLANPDTDFSDVLGAVGGLSLNLGVGMRWQVLGTFLNRFNVVYNAIRGFSNEMARAILGFTAPYYVDFCLCQYNNNITTCTESILRPVSGDNQSGFGGQRLLLPLVVSVRVLADDGSEIESSAYQKVKFEVVSGGGSVENEIANTEAGSSQASTYWTLGQSGDQKVKAVVVDMVTGVEVSDPVYFTATLRENADLTVRLDWNKLSGNTDIDLHVTDPFGEEIAYYHMNSASGGWLDRDDVIGPGPEHITWTNAPAGDYLVQVHYYGSETRAVTNYTININALGQNYGPFTGSIAYHQLVTIGTLHLPTGEFTRAADGQTFEEMFNVKENVTFPYSKK